LVNYQHPGWHGARFLTEIKKQNKQTALQTKVTHTTHVV
jgi:hypothetical protein